jgi:hypothetical protein
MSSQGFLRLSLSAALFCVAGFHVAHAATVTLVPSESTVSVGDTVSVDLNISGLGANVAPSLGTYDITVDFPSNFTFDNVVFGDPILGDELGPGAITEAIPGSSDVELIEVSLDSVAALNSGQPAAFTLADLTFTANGPGSGSFLLNNITLGDASGSSLSSSVSNATIGAVSSVPEPSTILPLCGLVALMGFMRKRIFS